MLCLHNFSLGDERSIALAGAIKGDCALSPQDKAKLSDTTYVLTAKEDSSIVYGILGFKADRLTSIEKHWDIGVHDELGFVTALYGLLKKVESEGNTTCHLMTSETMDPSVSLIAADFKCGTVLVGFNVIKAYGNSQISITEIVR